MSDNDFSSARRVDSGAEKQNLPPLPDREGQLDDGLLSAKPTAKRPLGLLDENSNSTLKVLVVDDDELVLMVTGALFEALGHRSYYARSIDEAEQAMVEALTIEEPFQVAVIDLVFSGDRVGDKINAALKALHPELVTIASSGQTADPILESPQDFNFDACLEKPYSLKNIDEVLKKLR